MDPTEDVAVVDGTVLHMEISSDPIPMSSPVCRVTFKGFGPGSLEHLSGLTAEVSSLQ